MTTKALRAKPDDIKVLKVDFSAKGKRARTPLAQRILQYTAAPSGPCGCTLWTGTVTPDNGYGMVRDGDKMLRVHRHVLEQKLGRKLRKGEHALHDPAVCSQNRLCIHPDHLYPGKPKQNSADAKASGSLVGRKLSPEKAREICERNDAGETIPELAKAFNVGPQSIRNVIRGITWGDETGRVYKPGKIGRPPKAKPVATTSNRRNREKGAVRVAV